MENIYSEIKVVSIPGFKIAKYIVISKEPEHDSNVYIDVWAEKSGLNKISGYKKRKIGWDFPVTKEQGETFGLHGYVSAYIIPDDFEPTTGGAEIAYIAEDSYATLTITDPFSAPWKNIPTGYDKLLNYSANKTLEWKNRVFDSWDNRIAFEETYEKDGVTYMDIFIPIADKVAR